MFCFEEVLHYRNSDTFYLMDLSGITEECKIRINIKEDTRIEKFHTIVWRALTEKPELTSLNWTLIMPSILQSIHLRCEEHRTFLHGQEASSDDEVDVIGEGPRKDAILESRSRFLHGCIKATTQQCSYSLGISTQDDERRRRNT